MVEAALEEEEALSEVLEEETPLAAAVTLTRKAAEACSVGYSEEAKRMKTKVEEECLVDCSVEARRKEKEYWEKQDA